MKLEFVKIKIVDERFEPGHLLVNVGTEVEWSIRFNEHYSNYSRPKSYVISFDSLPEESTPIKNKNDTFRVTF